MSGVDDRVHAGAAQAVDRGPRHPNRQARQQGSHTPDVAVVLAGLVGRTQDHIVDPGRVHPIPLHYGPNYMGGQVVRTHAS